MLPNCTGLVLISVGVTRLRSRHPKRYEDRIGPNGSESVCPDQQRSDHWPAHTEPPLF